VRYALKAEYFVDCLGVRGRRRDDYAL
jgi:hypothetical protein